MSRHEILQRFGAKGIQDFVPAFGRIGAITDDTQMSLFTAEGMLRSCIREELRGLCHPPSVIAHAYLRWLRTQGEHHALHERCLDGWLIEHEALHALRAPGNTCLSALRSLRSAGDEARNDSKGCGGVMRVAPVGMLMATLAVPETERSANSLAKTFDLGCQSAGITHGHPTGKLASGTFAAIVMRLLQGVVLPQAVDDALMVLRGHAGHEETLAAIALAGKLAAERPADATTIKALGEGWIAEEALAIGLYCALSVSDFRPGVVLAVNHDGDSDSTGSITGQLLGAIHGEASIPQAWRSSLELHAVIEEIAEDLATVATWRLDDPEHAEEGDYYFNKYPGA